ncbi:thioredoxin [Streptomyces albipurpureus]|uniref:Thioredoxin n=1 Tax=Streptomyces albipurpureus TaxID=2897419 RepID=A0ABT0UZ59_9ACTN|nr:thioredoxin [Streptomyces sp. CWNU-1]MCM2393853.1 thioredoxin [Streptomyces sp. CWNU-1]
MTAEQTGVRVQEALDRLAGSGAREAGEALVRELMAFYDEGLSGMVDALPPSALARVLDHPAAAGLLVLHDLHPEEVGARIDRALTALGQADIGFIGFDPDSGTLTLRRAKASGCGCGSGEQDIEDTIAAHAPEVATIVWQPVPALLQIGSRPPTSARLR